MDTTSFSIYELVLTCTLGFCLTGLFFNTKRGYAGSPKGHLRKPLGTVRLTPFTSCRPFCVCELLFIVTIRHDKNNYCNRTVKTLTRFNARQCVWLWQRCRTIKQLRTSSNLLVWCIIILISTAQYNLTVIMVDCQHLRCSTGLNFVQSSKNTNVDRVL